MTPEQFEDVRRLARSFCRRFGQQDLDDFESEAMIAWVKADGRFDEGRNSNHDGYCKTIVWYAMLDHLRASLSKTTSRLAVARMKDGREIGGALVTSEVQLQDWLPERETLDEQLAANELLRTIACMGGRSRTILELQLAGATQKEIAEVVGITPSRVSQLVARERYRLTLLLDAA